MKYVCTVCGFIYDEAKGDPDSGIKAGTKWTELPDDWKCPVCGASKAEFEAEMPKEASRPVLAESVSESEPADDFKELSMLEKSVLCSNLAKGCEKQYRAEEAELFRQLADYFCNAEPVVSISQDDGFEKILALINQNLEENIPKAKDIAVEQGDRGALRALTWCGKATTILKSLLSRRDAAEESGIWVCTICGFVFVGEVPPALCPVCKVPSWKMEAV
ncbi:MAG: rubredoxin [Spirochaetales bacterium]|nr:rubredoxin [Spirochaetales bacterium]